MFFLVDIWLIISKIALYQIIVNTLRILSMIGAYLILKKGGVAYSLFYVYIVFSFLIFISSQWVLKKTMHLGYSILIKHSYIPSLTVTICFVPVCFIHWNVHPLIHIVLLMLYLMVIVYHIGLSRKERNYLYNFLMPKFKYTRWTIFLKNHWNWWGKRYIPYSLHPHHSPQ